MSIQMHLLDAPGRLKRQRRILNKTFKSTASEVRERLPVRDVDVVFQVLPALTLPETGVGGFSPSCELSFIYLNPAHASFATSVKSEIGPTLAHELFHCARWLGPGFGTTLGEALVSEGLALHFETKFRDAPPFYATALGDEQIEKLLEETRPDFSKTQYGHAAWFHGLSGLGIPRFGGYSLAFRIVGAALEELGKEVTEVWDWRAADLLEASRQRI